MGTSMDECRTCICECCGELAVDPLSGVCRDCGHEEGDCPGDCPGRDGCEVPGEEKDGDKE